MSAWDTWHTREEAAAAIRELWGRELDAECATRLLGLEVIDRGPYEQNGIIDRRWIIGVGGNPPRVAIPMPAYSDDGRDVLRVARILAREGWTVRMSTVGGGMDEWAVTVRHPRCTDRYDEARYSDPEPGNALIRAALLALWDATRGQDK